MKYFIFSIIYIISSSLNLHSQSLSKSEVVQYLNDIDIKLLNNSIEKNEQYYTHNKYSIDKNGKVLFIERYEISNGLREKYRNSIFKILNKAYPSIYKNEVSFSAYLDKATRLQKELIISRIKKLLRNKEIEYENFEELINGKMIKFVYEITLEDIDAGIAIWNGTNIISITSNLNIECFRKTELDEYRMVIKESNVSSILLSDHRKSNYYNILQSSIRYLSDIVKKEVKDNYISFNNPFLKKSNSNNISKINKIELYKSGELFHLKSSVKNISFDFIFDSGASDCSINSEIFDQIKKLNDFTIYQKIADGLYKLADGSIVTQERYSISKLKVGEFYYDNIIFSISQNNAPNLLGQSFLKMFNSWTLDRENRKLILTN